MGECREEVWVRDQKPDAAPEPYIPELGIGGEREEGKGPRA